MNEFVGNTSPVMLALLAGIFTWGMTAAGAALVFLFREINRRLLDAMLGFAAGVMIAASFWSLLSPGIEMAESLHLTPWLVAVIGFISGALFVSIADRLLPHLHIGMPIAAAEGPKTSWKRSTLLVLAITIHNIPEGLAVGVAFGAVAAGFDAATIGGAVALALGIGIQNFPEGAAVSVPLRREGFSRGRSFLIGQYSGLVEPVAAVAGAYFVTHLQPILPFALCFAAGAMIYVVVEELIPEAQRGSEHDDWVTLATIGGFAVMMLLDVALG